MPAKDKKKKASREFALTNSGLNEYEFILLTEGYMLEEFKRNPIGYYMHYREKGVICLWEDFRIENDVVYATPVINLSNPLGEQALEEIENGFMTCASVGHIKLLEYRLESHPADPERTILVGTKWYNIETSIVDAPGNRNLLPKLFDENDNEINLADLTSKSIFDMKKITLDITTDLLGKLGLADNANPDAAALMVGITNLAAQVTQLQSEKATLTTERNAANTERDTAKTELQNLKAETVTKKVSDLLDGAEKEGKITAAEKAELATDYADKPERLEKMLGARQPYKPIADQLNDKANADEFAGKTFKELHKANKLPALKSKNPELYKKLFKDEYGKEPKM